MGPLQAPNGIHLIRVAALRDTAKIAKNNVGDERARIQQLIFQRKLEEGLQTWIAKLRTGAYININETEIA